MSITVFWDDVVSDIMRIDYEGQWTLEDQINLGKLARDMLGDEKRQNDVIIYVHEHTSFPRMLPPKDILHIVKDIPANPGVRVIVGAPTVMQTVLDIFSGTIGGKMGVEITTAKSLESARELIYQKRAHRG